MVPLPLRGRAMALGWLLASALGPACSRDSARTKGLGRQIYEGERPLAARLANDDTALPSVATRCVNCHTRTDEDEGDSSERTIGPTLSPRALTTLRRRHGGPPTRYDRASFCRLLTNGIDPAQILIPRVMPRYDIDEASCEALWTFLNATHP